MGSTNVGAAELEAFLATVDDTPPNAVSACRGWTAHDIVAHLTSGADSFAAQIEAYIEGRPIPIFEAEDVREPPYRAIDDAVLRRRFVAAERRMAEAIAEATANDPTVSSDEVAWGIPIAALITHMRQEYAVHRWDLVGDDEASFELLAAPEFVTHSIRYMGGSLLEEGLRRDHADPSPLTARIRCLGTPDVVLSVGGGRGELVEQDAVDSDEVIETDPAARLLMMWGRRPTDSRRTRSHLPLDHLTRVQTLLSGW